MWLCWKLGRRLILHKTLKNISGLTTCLIAVQVPVGALVTHSANSSRLTAFGKLRESLTPLRLAHASVGSVRALSADVPITGDASPYASLQWILNRAPRMAWAMTGPSPTKKLLLI